MSSKIVPNMIANRRRQCQRCQLSFSAVLRKSQAEAAIVVAVLLAEEVAVLRFEAFPHSSQPYLRRYLVLRREVAAGALVVRSLCAEVAMRDGEEADEVSLRKARGSAFLTWRACFHAKCR